MATKRVTYKEPASFFPKEIRKECGLGEFNKDTPAKKKAVKNTKKSTKK